MLLLIELVCVCTHLGFEGLVHVAWHFFCPSAMRFTIVSAVRTLETTIIHLLSFACVYVFFSVAPLRSEKKRAKSRSLSWNIKLEEIGQTPFFIYYCLHLWPSNEGSC